MKACLLAAFLVFLTVVAGCGVATESDRSGSADSLPAAVARKAIEDSGFDIPAEIYVREALYDDVPADPV